MMTPLQELEFFLECTLGQKAHLNCTAKIILAPLVIFLAAILFTLDVMFGEVE